MVSWFDANPLGSAIEAAEQEFRWRRPERDDPPQWLVPLSEVRPIKLIYAYGDREVIPMDGMMVGVGLGPVWRHVLASGRNPDLPCSSALAQMIAESSGHSLVPLLGVIGKNIHVGVQLRGTQCAVPSSIGSIETVRYACLDMKNAHEILVTALHLVNSLLSR